METQYVVAILTISAGQAFSALKDAVEKKEIDSAQVRKSYALTAVYVLAFGSALTYATDSPQPLLASLPIIAGTIAAQEFAIAISKGTENPELK